MSTTMDSAQPGQSILVEDNNTSDYFMHYKEKKYSLDNKK